MPLNVAASGQSAGAYVGNTSQSALEMVDRVHLRQREWVQFLHRVRMTGLEMRLGVAGLHQGRAQLGMDQQRLGFQREQLAVQTELKKDEHGIRREEVGVARDRVEVDRDRIEFERDLLPIKQQEADASTSRAKASLLNADANMMNAETTRQQENRLLVSTFIRSLGESFNRVWPESPKTRSSSSKSPTNDVPSAIGSIRRNPLTGRSEGAKIYPGALQSGFLNGPGGVIEAIKSGDSVKAIMATVRWIETAGKAANLGEDTKAYLMRDVGETITGVKTNSGEAAVATVAQTEWGYNLNDLGPLPDVLQPDVYREAVNKTARKMVENSKGDAGTINVATLVATYIGDDSEIDKAARNADGSVNPAVKVRLAREAAKMYDFLVERFHRGEMEKADLSWHQKVDQVGMQVAVGHMMKWMQAGQGQIFTGLLGMSDSWNERVTDRGVVGQRDMVGFFRGLEEEAAAGRMGPKTMRVIEEGILAEADMELRDNPMAMAAIETGIASVFTGAAGRGVAATTLQQLGQAFQEDFRYWTKHKKSGVQKLQREVMGSDSAKHWINEQTKGFPRKTSSG